MKSHWVRAAEYYLEHHPDGNLLDFAVVVHHDRNQKKVKFVPGQHNNALAVYHDPKGSTWVVPERRYSAIGINTKYGVWIPMPDEVRPCCQGLIPRSYAKYPWTYQRHCSTIRHIAMLFNVDERDLSKRVAKERPEPYRCPTCKKFLSEDLYACGKCLWKQRNGLDNAVAAG